MPPALKTIAAGYTIKTITSLRELLHYWSVEVFAIWKKKADYSLLEFHNSNATKKGSWKRKD